MKILVPTLLTGFLLASCVTVLPPPNRSTADPVDPSSSGVGTPYAPDLIASTRVFLDPSAGEGAQKMDHSMHSMEGMDHSKMEGMDHSKMSGMDHSKMEDMDHSKMPGMDHSKMEGMDHSKMQGTGAEPAKPQSMENMPGMDHSKMPGMSGKKGEPMPGMKHEGQPAKGDAAKPADAEATAEQMKKTADEMKKASDELKAKSDALQKDRGTKPGATPAPQEAKPEDHPHHPK